MYRIRTTSVIWFLLCACSLVGCTHNHYYYTGSDAIQVDGTAPLRLGKASQPRGSTLILSDSPTRVVSSSPASKSAVTSNLCDDSNQTIVLSSPPRIMREDATKASSNRVVISRPTSGAVARNNSSDGWYPLTRSSKVDRLVSTEDLGDLDSPQR